MPPAAKTYVYTVIVAGLMVFALSMPGAKVPALMSYAQFFILVVLSSAGKLRLPGLTGTYSFNFLFLLYGLFEFDLPAVLLAGLVGAVAQSVLNVQKRPQAIQIAFNAANLVLSLAVCFGLLRLFTGHHWLTFRPALMAFVAAVYFAVNTGFVSGVLSLLQGKPLSQVAEEWYVWSFPYFLIGAAFLGLLPGGDSKSISPASWLAVLPLLYLVHFFYGLSRGARPKGSGGSAGLTGAASGLPSSARWFVGSVVVAGALIFAFALFNWSCADPLRFAGYAALALVASTWKVRLPGMVSTISVNFVIILVAILELSMGETMLISAGVAALQSLWRTARRPRLHQIAFNMSALVISAAAAFAVGRFLVDAPIANSLPAVLPLTVTTFYGVNALLVTRVIAAAEGQRMFEVWRTCYFWSLPYYLVGAGGAGLMIATQRTVGWQPALAILPLIMMVYVSYRAHVSRSGAATA